MLPYFFRDMMRPLRMLEREMRLLDEVFHHPSLYRVNRPKLFYELDEDFSKRDAVIQDKDKFQVKLDVQDFQPNEISVKTVNGNAIQIEAKHEEKHDEDKGFISRQLIRRFVLPHGHDLKNASSSLSADGVLTITAPRVVKEIEQEKSIPITHEIESKEEQK